MKHVIKNTIRCTLLNLFFLCLNSCGVETNENDATTSLWGDYISPQIIKDLKIKSRIKTEINTNPRSRIVIWSNGVEISPNKINTIEYFNSDGLCTLKVFPSYKLIKNDTTGFSKLSPWDQLLFKKEIESNEPTGFADSTFLFYDTKNRNTKREFRRTTRLGYNYLDYIETSSYDDNGNIIEMCFDYPNSNLTCRYSKIKYNSKKKILSQIDSFTLDIQNPTRQVRKIERNYTYNERGLINSINDAYYVYDQKNLLIEKYIKANDVKSDIEYYTYDNNNHCIKVEHIRCIRSTYDPNTKITTYEKFDTSLLLKQYDNKGLIIELSSKYSREYDEYQLFKYEYRY
jgi:hypothetical protein